MPAKIKHIAIVSDQYALEGRCYEAVFGMKTASDTRPERAVTVSDGYVGLNINPRKAGRPAGLDHFGLEVEDAQAVCARLRERHPDVHVLKRPGTRPFAGISPHDPVGDNNPHLRPLPVGVGPEGEARLKLFAGCPCGAYHLADPDGVLIDIAEK